MDLPANYEKHVIVCQLCDKVLVKPKTLQCLHSFCSACLLIHFKSIPVDNRANCSFSCPSCRTVTKLPVSDVPVDSWLPLLPNSCLLTALIEKVSLEGVKTCGPCSRGDVVTTAMSWCYDCGEFLCEHCVTYHQRMKVLMDHTVLNTEEIRNKPHKMAETEELCQTHAGKVVEAFCYDHDHLCCLDCVTYDHRKCQKVKSLDEIACGIKESGVIKSVADKLKWVEDHTLAVINSRSNTIEELGRKQEAILSDVASLRDEIETLLQQMEEKLKEELSKMHEAIVEQLKVQSKDFEYICKAAENGKKILAVSEAMGAENEVYVTTQKLRKRCEEHDRFMKSESSRVFDYNYEFVVNDVINEFTRNVLSVGKINIMRAPNNILPAFLKDRRIEKLLEINGKCPTDSNHCWFTGGLFTSKGFLVLADYRNRRLKCFNETGDMLSSIDLRGQPWDICELANGELAFTVPDESTICLVALSKEGEITLRSETMEVGTGCHGIQLLDEALVIACSNEIRVLDRDGKLQSTRPLEDRGTRYVMANRDNVVFTDKVGITSKDLSGSHVFKYRDPDLRSPRGFARDHEGNLYVCGMDSNNVHQLTKDGLLNKVLLTAKDGIRNPYAIGFQREGTTLFLTQMDCDVVLLYKLVTRW
ncbi:probable E3 ubiquitin-protein ligase TRIM8 [Mizuhopecten yessoensis]|uniref:E3 ubiquitin-protein ligase TRIM33 n=1 Tax=Mizuhopecten yessoensis TaxID=6573 RepID=A0A210Q629_MIZYE|nr:probable E3 ubiquitin-protein ligase TRIM8 [Mizuhopecten yessoensis]OWF44193.1 E3 ubiquitin-protein ligase TRIM33 [Mizuhopecten yessoensis]